MVAKNYSHLVATSLLFLLLVISSAKAGLGMSAGPLDFGEVPRGGQKTLSYEIINSSPEYCFIPSGTGQLYENILNINKKEVSTKFHDPRFSGNVEILRNCNFIGATINNKNSKAEKLYSPHLPFMHYDEQWIKLYKHSGFCGKESTIYNLEEKFLDEAIKIAAKEKIECEPSGIAGLAMLLQMKNIIPKDAKILIINTGKTKIL